MIIVKFVMILIITVTGMVYNGEVYSQCSLSDIWTSLISVDRLDLQVAIVYVGVYSKTICTRAQGT